MEAEWLQAAEEAQCTSFDVIACVPLVVLKELDLIKGRVQRVGHAEVAESRALIYQPTPHFVPADQSQKCVLSASRRV